MYRPVLAQGSWQKHGRQHHLVVKWHTAPSDCGLWAALRNLHSAGLPRTRLFPTGTSYTPKIPCHRQPKSALF